MKTIIDLKALIPEIAEALRIIPDIISEQYNEDSSDTLTEQDAFLYDEDGWNIEFERIMKVYYESASSSYYEPGYLEFEIKGIELCGPFTIYHEDDETSTFSECEIEEFITELEEYLKLI